MHGHHILLLGAIAGFTIFLGLPVGRIRSFDVRVKAALNAIAIGVLLFLLWDVLSQALEPIKAALTAVALEHKGSWESFTSLAAVAVGFFCMGLMGLVYYDQWIGRRRRKKDFLLGPGTASVGEFGSARMASVTLSNARALSLMIATGIGLHNFAEGLAIGQSAASGEIGLAMLLVIGFGLHNATEGFGIVAPLTGGRDRPGWGFLALLGLIGGGPTFLGTVVGQSVVNTTLSVGFLAGAAGSILYVIIELLGVNRTLGHKTLVTWCLIGGLLLGFATDLILVAAGA